ncbi:unnamed protein product [Absidia cylindrospora]
MVHQEEQHQPDSTSPTNNSNPAESTEMQPPDEPQQSSQHEPFTFSTTSPPTQQKATTPLPPLQEELGKSFASRRIQVASLAIRSSHSASQSPLFPKHDMFKLYQQPFVASSLSTPTATFAPPIPNATTSHSSNGISRSLLPSSSSPTSTTDRALLDRTWSVLAPKSESNQQHRKKPRRRVTFNDNIEFFELPPQINYYDDIAPPPTYSSSPSPDATTKTTDLDDYGERQKEYQQDIEKGNSPGPTQITNQWDESYTDASNESSSPGLQTADIPEHQISPCTSPSSVTSSTSTTSSNSMATLSLSSSSTQSNSINNNTTTLAMSYDQQSPLFNQHINASTSSLPAYNPMSSSTVSLALSTSSSPNSTTTDMPSSQIALQRKGNTISRNAILEILSSRTPSSHHRFTPSRSNNRLSKHNSKRLSLQQQQPHHQVPIDFHRSLDSVENEIREAIQRAKASNAGRSTNLPTPKTDTSGPSTNDTRLHHVNGRTADFEPRNESTSNDDGNDDGNSEGMDPACNNNQDQPSGDIPNQEQSLAEIPMDNLNQEQSLDNIPTDGIMDGDQLYSGDDSDSTTIHGENNSNETIYMDAHDQGDDGDGDDPHGNGSPSQDAATISHQWSDDSDENTEDTESSNASNPLLLYLPSSEQQICDFGDTLRDEFDRITGDMTHMVVPTSTLTAASNMDNREPNANVSDISINQDTYSTSNDTRNGEQDREQINSVAWQVLGCQDESDIPVKNRKPENDQPQNSTKNGRLYIKVIAAENLDFPINQNAPSIQCSVNDGTHYFGSGHYKMQHDIHFNHEFILDDINADTEFTLTLHAIRQADQKDGSSPTKRWSKRTSLVGAVGGGGGGGSGRADDLSRYINRQDGALAQTRVSLSAVSYQCRTRLCTASFALVNGWYQPAKKSGARHPLLLSRASKEKRQPMVQEKAVGKLTIELFYLPNVELKLPDLPVDMDSCENALNIQRFHQTIWRSGYMSQLGGDVKYWRRRYFKLIGGHLYSYTDTLYSPRTMIDLTKAVVIASDNRIIMEATTNATGNNQRQQEDYPHHQGNSNRVFGNDVGHNLLVALESQTNISTVERDHHHAPPYTHPHQNSSSNINVSAIATHSQPQLSAVPLSSNRSNSGGGGGSFPAVYMTTSTHHESLSGGGDADDLSSYSVKNSFQLKFDNGEMIEFFCDSAHERERWLDVLKVIIGRIPPLPSWLSV